jgi:CspA family cold shock protein
MNFKDRWAVNEKGENFIFTVEMQRRLSQMGLPVDPDQVKELDDASHEQRDLRPQPPKSSSSVGPVERELETPATIQIDPQTGKYIGRMKWYNVKKGYGFIVRGGGEEIFFHKTGSIGDPTELQEGQWILYDVEETHKGPEATDIEPYEGDVDLLA